MKATLLILVILVTSCTDTKNKDRNINTPYSDKEINNHSENANTNNIEIRLYKGDYGWGYDILINKKPYIHQPNIPCIEGTKGFVSKEKARKAAELVVIKIKSNVIPPSLNVKELDSINSL